MTAASQHAHLAVMGAGPAGYPAAFMAADLGLDVALIDPRVNPGGVCLYQGCIPSKTYLHVAKLLNEAREAADWGIHFGTPRVDLDRLRRWKDEVVSKLTGGLASLRQQHHVRAIRARARFLDAHTLALEKEDGAVETLAFDHAIVATGSRPVALPGVKLQSPRLMDSTAALELANVPRTLLVAGGGYIGLELGSVYAALGSEVTVVEAGTALLAGGDPDLVEFLQRRLELRFKALYLGAKVTGITEEADGLRVKMLGLHVPADAPLFEKVLVAIGRRPNSEGLGLENTRVEVDKRGFVKVDRQRRTAEPHVFAIGDLAGQPMLAHKATHEARVAVETIAGRGAVFQPLAIPAVVFTDPEVAWCGLTETLAKTEGRDVRIARFPWTASGRATTLDRNDGLTKLILDPRNEQVLGVGIVGVGAGELLAEGVLAVEMGARATDLKLTIHAHPTLAETVMEAADVYFGQSPHLFPHRPA